MKELRQRKQEALDHYQKTKDKNVRAEMRKIDKEIKDILRMKTTFNILHLQGAKSQIHIPFENIVAIERLKSDGVTIIATTQG